MKILSVHYFLVTQLSTFKNYTVSVAIYISTVYNYYQYSKILQFNTLLIDLSAKDLLRIQLRLVNIFIVILFLLQLLTYTTVHTVNK